MIALAVYMGHARASWCVFFFASRRRHTRLQGDWSSDVCSSDLQLVGQQNLAAGAQGFAVHGDELLVQPMPSFIGTHGGEPAGVRAVLLSGIQHHNHFAAHGTPLFITGYGPVPAHADRAVTHALSLTASAFSTPRAS